jgi:HSP20 family molecular chaperone IbpA
MREEFNALVDRFFDDPWMRSHASGLTEAGEAPRFGRNWDLGWEDTGKEYVFRAELPGFEPEDFDVKVSGNLLTIRAEHRDETYDKNGRSSYRHGSFSRTFTLPQAADHEKVDARYHSGVLEVCVPKDAQVAAKRIPVNVR